MSETMSPTSHTATGHESASKPAKAAKKPSVTKATAEDWQTTLRQSFAAGITMLGEILVKAGKELTQTKTPGPAKKRRNHAAAQH